MHIYAFSPGSRGIPTYERTFGSLIHARRWAEKAPGRFLTFNSLPKRCWY